MKHLLRRGVALFVISLIASAGFGPGALLAAAAQCASVSARTVSADPNIAGANDRANILTITLQADCDQGTSVRSITLVYLGGGEVKKVRGVSATLNGVTIADSTPIDPVTMTATLHFKKPLALAPHARTELTIVGTFDITAGIGYHSVMVELPTDVLTDAGEVTGFFPLNGPMLILPAPSARNVCLAAAAHLGTTTERSKARKTCRASR